MAQPRSDVLAGFPKQLSQERTVQLVLVTNRLLGLPEQFQIGERDRHVLDLDGRMNLLASAYSMPQEHFIRSMTNSSPTLTTTYSSKSSGATSRSPIKAVVNHRRSANDDIFGSAPFSEWHSSSRSCRVGGLGSSGELTS